MNAKVPFSTRSHYICCRARNSDGVMLYRNAIDRSADLSSNSPPMASDAPIFASPVLQCTTSKVKYLKVREFTGDVTWSMRSLSYQQRASIQDMLYRAVCATHRQMSLSNTIHLQCSGGHNGSVKAYPFRLG